MNVRAGIVIALLFWSQLFAQELAPQNDSIRKEDLKADLFYLAHDLTEGRLVGTPGNALAAEFVKSRFERLGLVPAGSDGSFFQSFNLTVVTLGEDNRLEVVDEGGASMRLRPGVQNFEAVAQAYWPATPPRIDRSALRGSYTR